MRTSTILKPSDLRAPGALTQLFAHHRQQFGGWVMEDGGAGSGGDGSGGQGGSGDGGSGSGSGAGGSGGSGGGQGGDAGSDLGFPPDTPVADMTPEQKAAFDRHKREQNKAERARWRSVTGDRTPEQLKADLDKLAEYEKAQLTPSERQLQDAREQATSETRAAMRAETATTIYETALETLNVPEADIPALVRGFNATGFITDDGVDRAAITSFAKKFAPAGTADQRRRDFGAGARGDSSQGTGVSAGRARYEERHPKKS
jgi:hypothetical protein